jgi:hypothetical protein
VEQSAQSPIRRGQWAAAQILRNIQSALAHPDFLAEMDARAAVPE